MKYILSLCLAFMLSGCFKDEPNVLNIEAFKAKPHKTLNSKTIQRVFLHEVADLRANPHVLGSYKDGKTYIIKTDTRLNVWLFEGLRNALIHEGYEISNKQTQDSLNISVQIENIDARYTAAKKQDNMLIDLSLRVTYKKYVYFKSENINISRKLYFKSLPSKQEFEKQVYEILKSAINGIILKANTI